MNGKHSHSNKTAGFTLVEIAIVVSIIALLTGGIMAGTSLIRVARVQSIISDKNFYQQAIVNFRDKYKALPGDFAGANAIWGAQDADAGTCARTTSTTKATCNGDGDDHIFGSTASGFRLYERFRMWQHLANAELIEGSYSGTNNCTNETNSCYKAGTNSPFSKIKGATWAVFDRGQGTVDAWLYSQTATPKAEYKHVMYFGGEQASGNFPLGKILKPKEMWGIDQKFDDGKPGTGTILSLMPSVNSCASTNVATTALYNLSNDNYECAIVFRLPF